MTEEKGGEIAPAIAEMFSAMGRHMQTEHPLFGKLAVKPVRFGRGDVAVKLTAEETFADGEAIHSGLYTILLDTLLGMPAWSTMEQFEPIATINLKTDVMGQAAPGARILCEAECSGIVDDVAVCHGRASMGGTLIAKAAGTFLVGTRSAQVSGI